MAKNNLVEKIGKRLKSDKQVTMYKRFPNSDVTKTLAVGKPSPKITSIIKRDKKTWFQLEAEGESNWYVKNKKAVKVVPEDAPDESSTIWTLWNQAKDFVGNTTKEANKQAGFLKSGFEESVEGVGKGLFSFVGNIGNILLIAGGIIVVILVLIVILNFSRG